MTVPADWQDFAQVIGAASGALTGLLFVAVWLNANRIEGHRGLRASAAQTLVLFLAPARQPDRVRQRGRQRVALPAPAAGAAAQARGG